MKLIYRLLGITFLSLTLTITLFTFSYNSRAQGFNQVLVACGSHNDFIINQDSFIDREVVGIKSAWFGNFRNTPDYSTANIIGATISLSTELTFKTVSPTPNNIGSSTYRWILGDLPEYTTPDVKPQTGIDLINNAYPITFTPGFDVVRKADYNSFTDYGVQTLTLTITSHTDNNLVIYVLKPDKCDFKAKITSPISNEAQGYYLNENGTSLEIHRYGIKNGYTESFVIVTELSKKGFDIDYMPQIGISNVEVPAQGTARGDSFSYTLSGLGTWTWSATGTYDWNWSEINSKRVILNGSSRSYTTPITPETITPTQPHNEYIESVKTLQIDTTTTEVSWIISLIIVMVFYFAATLFNSTLKENYGTIREWVKKSTGFKPALNKTFAGRLENSYKRKSYLRLYLEGFLVIMVCSLIYSFIYPYFIDGLEKESVALFLALAVGITISTIGYDGIQVLVSRQRYKVISIIGMYWVVIPIAIIFTLISYYINFHPGLIFGFVGAFIVLTSSEKLDGRKQALLVIWGSLAVLLAVILAFFIRNLIQDQDNSSFGWILLENILVSIQVIGIEGLVFLFIPLKFMDGYKVLKWNRWVWLVTTIILTFIFCLVLFSNHYEELDKLITLVNQLNKEVSPYIMASISLVFSLGVWFFFKQRHKEISD
jgi:hypothetical protein